MPTKERPTKTLKTPAKPTTAAEAEDTQEEAYQPKERQRGWGEGTIVERVGKTGKVSYLAKCWVNGKRCSKTLPTRPKAQSWIRNTITNGEKGITPTDASKKTVAAFLDEWLNAKKATLKPKAYQDYSWAVKSHLGPAFPKMKLADLRANHLQALYGKTLEAGLSARSVHHLHRVMHNALAQAVKWDLLPRNVAEAATPPKPVKKEQTVWTPEQASVFIKGVAGERFEAMFIVAITCGLRVGEIAGLKWEDVDLDAGTIQIRRTRQRIKTDGPTKTVIVDGAPKTKKGARLIVLPALTLAALKRWKAKQNEERLLLGEAWKNTGYIFTWEDGGATEPDNFHNSFVRIVATLRLPRIRPHDLRHTCATVLLSQNTNPKIVQELLGHSQIAVTMDLYSHVLPGMQQEAARTMERVFGAG